MFNFLRKNNTDPQKPRLDKAKAFIQAGELHRGMAELQELAEEKYPEAEYTLGEIYEFGIKDISKALAWYGRAAAHGNPQAQFSFAGMYMAGRGVAKDEKTAFSWYKKSAENGIPEAQFVLGEFYRVGDVVPQDLIEARKWYSLVQKSENSYSKSATLRLKQMETRPVPQTGDLRGKTAFVYRNLEEAPVEQLMATGLMYFLGDRGQQDYKKAAEHVEVAAKKGHPDAQFMIGMMYKGGQGVVKSYETAFSWLLKAAKQNNPDAAFEVAIFYDNGVVVQKDSSTANTFLRKAASLGHQKAIAALQARVR